MLFLADPLAADTGFLVRFLMCEPPSAIGTRMQANARNDDMALAAYSDRLRSILATPLPMDADMRELRLRVRPLATDARAGLSGSADAVEAAQASVGDLAYITGTACRTAEQAERIAGVLTLWVDVDAPHVKADVTADAVALARFCLSEASRLANAAAISAEIDMAEALRRWLLQSWSHPDVMARDAVQKGPDAMCETAKARAALGVLEKYGWLVGLDAGAVVRGAARAERWHIVKGGSDLV